MEIAIDILNFASTWLLYGYMYIIIKRLFYVLTGKQNDISFLEWKIRFLFGISLIRGYVWVLGGISLISWIIWALLFILALREWKRAVS